MKNYYVYGISQELSGGRGPVVMAVVVDDGWQPPARAWARSPVAVPAH